MVMDYRSPSSLGWRVGCLCSQRAAFPRQRVVATRPKRCLVEVVGSGEPDLCPTAWPIARMVVMASSARPPKVSATKGMHSIPTDRQAERLVASLRLTPT